MSAPKGKPSEAAAFDPSLPVGPHLYDLTYPPNPWRDIGWQDIPPENDLDASTANVLRDLAALAEQHDDLLVETPSKRKLPQEESPRKKPALVPEARKRMNSLLERQSSARKAVETAEKELSASQQLLVEAQREFREACEATTQGCQQLCEDLLQEDTAWNNMYRLLLSYKERHGGDVQVPRHATKEQKTNNPDLTKLANWVGRQRSDYRRPLEDSKRLQEYQIFALDKIGFDWDPHRTTWMKRYQELKEFKAIHGHANVPYVKPGNHVMDDKKAGETNVLGTWVKRQQHQYKLLRDGKDETSEMTEERIQLLEEIGFQWSRRAVGWLTRYKELKQHKQAHGDTQPTEKSLADWTKEQRRQYKRYEEDPVTSNLSKEQYELLKELAFDLDLRNGSWMTRFQELIKFKAQHGHTILPSKYPLNQKLVNWVATQRRHHLMMKEGKPSQLTEERIKILDDAGFEWQVSSSRRDETSRALVKTWDEQYADLLDRRNHVGTLDAGKHDDLRAWTATQLEQYQLAKEGKPTLLSQDQVSKLREVGFDDVAYRPSSRSLVKSWEDMYAELLKHRLIHSSFHVSTQQAALYHWVREQRTEYEKYVDGKPSALCIDRINKLNKVSFPWKADGRDLNAQGDLPKSWEEMFGELLAFRIQFESFDVPKNMQLFSWIAAQRLMRTRHLGTATNKSALAAERIRKLDDIGFPWEAKESSVAKEESSAAPPADVKAPPPSAANGPTPAGLVALPPSSTRGRPRGSFFAPPPSAYPGMAAAAAAAAAPPPPSARGSPRAGLLLFPSSARGRPRPYGDIAM